MLTNEGISVSDALALRNYGNDGGFGGNGSWWVVLLILLFAGGWNNGFGNFGGNGGFSACCTPATAQGVSDAFNFNQIDNGLRGIQSGLDANFCNVQTTLAGLGRETAVGFDSTNLAVMSGFDSTNLALANGFNGVQQTVNNCCCDIRQGITEQGYQTQLGLSGIDKSLMQSAYQTQAGLNNLATQQAADTCSITRGQDVIRSEIAQATRDINIASERNTDRILGYLTQTEMERLRSELQSANFQISQQAQTSDIINNLMPVAKPAYITCSPYASSFGIGNGYGCSCGCSH